MISTLYTLQKALDKLDAPSAASRLHEVADEVTNICEAISAQALTAYRQIQQLDLARVSFQQYHRKLIRLYNTVYKHHRQHNEYINLIFNSLSNLLKEQEHIYFDHIDLSIPLPDYEQQTLHTQVKERLAILQEQLQKKGISNSYLSEIAFAMDSLFHPHKLPLASYHHRYYLPRLLNALEALAADQRQKNWQQRFMHIVINYNFNYMGLFNRWCEEQDHVLLEAIHKEESGAYFRQSKNSLRYHHPMSGMAYDPQNSSLWQHMKQHLADQKHDFKQAPREAAMAHPSALHINLSSSEMTVDFHYKYKFGYYPHSTKREAAKAYAQAHRSKTGLYISPHTLEKVDKKELEAAATKMRSKLLKMAQQIKEDFNL